MDALQKATSRGDMPAWKAIFDKGPMRPHKSAARATSAYPVNMAGRVVATTGLEGKHYPPGLAAAASKRPNSSLQKSISAACSKNQLARRGKKSRLKRI
jgi:hypothetical protein